MSVMSKIFGQNAKGENGSSVFFQHWQELREMDRDRFADPIQLTPFGAIGPLGDYMATAILGGALGFFAGVVIAAVTGVPAEPEPRFNAGANGAGYGAAVGMILCALRNPIIASYRTYKDVSWKTPPEAPKP